MKDKSTLAWETYRDRMDDNHVPRSQRYLKRNFILIPFLIDTWYDEYLAQQLGELPVDPIPVLKIKKKKPQHWQPFAKIPKKPIRILNPK